MWLSGEVWNVSRYFTIVLNWEVRDCSKLRYVLRGVCHSLQNFRVSFLSSVEVPKTLRQLHLQLQSPHNIHRLFTGMPRWSFYKPQSAQYTDKIIIEPKQDSEIISSWLSLFVVPMEEGRAVVEALHQALSIKQKHFMPILHIFGNVICCKLMAKRGSRSHKKGRSGSRKRAEQIRMYWCKMVLSSHLSLFTKVREAISEP